MARPYAGLLPMALGRVDVAEAEVIEETALALLPGPGLPALSPRPSPRWRVGPVDRRLKALGIVFAAVVALIVLRAPIVAALPEMKRMPVEIGLLEFQKVRSETVTRSGVSTLFVEGEIVNRSTGPVELPAIKVTLRSSAGEPVTSWLVELAADGLAAGRVIGFRSALASPPAEAAQVTLNFSDRGGQLALQ